jgi:hypothetical protein
MTLSFGLQAHGMEEETSAFTEQVGIVHMELWQKNPL